MIIVEIIIHKCKSNVDPVSFLLLFPQSKEVQHTLLDLFCSEYMSSSLKLQIVKALDASTRLKEGLDWFLGQHHLQVENGTEIEGDGCDTDLDRPTAVTRQTGYQRLLDIMLQKQVIYSICLAKASSSLCMYVI